MSTITLISTDNLRLLRLEEVIQKTGLSKAHIYDFMLSQEFPLSVKIAPRSVAWIESEINAWILAQIEKSRRDLS